MIEHRSPTRARVFAWLESGIARGELRPGAAIPSERTIAAALGIARNTASSALAEAEKRGMLVRRSPTGRKRFLVDSRRDAAHPYYLRRENFTFLYCAE